VTAWDAETGAKLWKFYIVPTDPAAGPDGEASDSAMQIAQSTWYGRFWKRPRAAAATPGTASPTIPSSTSSTSAPATAARTCGTSAARGKGDNLVPVLVVAVDATTGEYRWHYQEVPEEDWDFTCTQPMVLADLTIDGQPRKVLMHAPKNAFFYVIDRTNGRLISGKSYTSVNTWASGLDANAARSSWRAPQHHDPAPDEPELDGRAHLAPMAYSPLTGLTYFSAQEQGSVYARAADGAYRYVKGRSNSGQAFGTEPELRQQLQAEAVANEKGYLLAWNPVTQSEAWRVDYGIPGSGGVLATAGNLLIQGTINKTLAIYRADTGPSCGR
jgi:quinohemoprotein ethanol dehydrogenase